jgi:hypothetical protein
MVRNQLRALATKTRTAEPSKTDEKPVISLIGADLAESARIALDHYNI